jgi:trimethylamine--corrinoid protein Co-methyltransferase
MVRQMLRGIEITEETLALDVIDAVGPGNHFLGQKHTRKHMRELWLPKYMDRRPYSEWLEKQDGAVDWATEEAKRILETHRPEPLDPQLSAELEKIISSLEPA